MSMLLRQSPKQTILLTCLLLTLIIFLASNVYSAQVAMEWDPSPSPDVDGYVVYYGRSSGSYTASVDVGNTTSCVISSLEEGETYYFAATSYVSKTEGSFSEELFYTLPIADSDGDGPIADSDGDGIPDSEEIDVYGTDPEIPDTDNDGLNDGDELAFWGDNWAADSDEDGIINLLDPNSDDDGFSDGLEVARGYDPADPTVKPETDLIWLEAENGYLNVPMDVSSDEAASSGEYIWVPNGHGNVWNPDKDAGYAEYTFQVSDPGDYVIWGRVLAISGLDNSFFISVDDGAYALWDTQQANTWVWDQVNNRNGFDPVTHKLEAGQHTLLIKQREDGTKLDKIFITNDMEFVPQELGDKGETVTEILVSARSDDAEEQFSGSMQLSSTDLDLGSKSVGLRFTSVNIPQGASIINAYLQFQADEIDTAPSFLTIEGEDVDDAPTFNGTLSDITSRTTTTTAVSWSPAPWTTVGEAGPNQRTPNIASVIQEIVSRSVWSSGNSLVLIITGNGGERAAESLEGNRAGAPLLHVEYTPGDGTNQPPTAAISAPTDGATFNQGDPITFTGAANDPEDGDVTASLSWISDIDGTIGTGGTFSSSDLSVGVHTIKAMGMDSGGLTGSDQITITVVPLGKGITIEIRVEADSDDAEEKISGSMELSSTDLDLGSKSVGIRFTSVNIPQGASIINAYLQFQADEIDTAPSFLTIEGEDVDDAPTFNGTLSDITSRTTTTAAVSWSPAPWTTVGEAGPDQRTPNIASVIQEIVGRPFWSSGNSLVLIITGNGGEREAESLEANKAGAPLLHVEYSDN